MIILSKIKKVDDEIIVHSYWANLINHIHKEYTLPNEVWYQVHYELSQFNATVYGDDIIFDDDQQASLFLMRWS